MTPQPQTPAAAETTDWAVSPSPFGHFQTPGMDERRAMSDQQLCDELNGERPVHPAAFAELRTRTRIGTDEKRRYTVLPSRA